MQTRATCAKKKLHRLNPYSLWHKRQRHISHKKIDQLVVGVFDIFYPKDVETNGYYVAHKPITLSCILFMFIEMKFIHCHSCVCLK